MDRVRSLGCRRLVKQNREIIADNLSNGIRGVTTGNGDAIPVLIDSADQLGTASSSARFKKEIKPMDKASEAVLALKPVTFHYKSDTKGTPQFACVNGLNNSRNKNGNQEPQNGAATLRNDK